MCESNTDNRNSNELRKSYANNRSCNAFNSTMRNKNQEYNECGCISSNQWSDMVILLESEATNLILTLSLPMHTKVNNL